MKNSKGVEIPEGLEPYAKYLTKRDVRNCEELRLVYNLEQFFRGSKCERPKWERPKRERSKWERLKDFIKDRVFFFRSKDKYAHLRLPDCIAPEEFTRWVRMYPLCIHVNIVVPPPEADLYNYNSADNEPEPEFIDIRV